MIDPFGRRVTYLRLSVTDRCDLRCTYCMADDIRFVPRSGVLSLEELSRLAHLLVAKGIRKIRLTGGEPLVRRNVLLLIRDLGGLVKAGRLDELTLTTNGTQLAAMAGDIAEAGVARINVSLDTLDSERFVRITRRGDLAQVLAGLAVARQAGLKIRVNAVVQRGVNEDGIDDLVAWCGGQGFDLGLIELMPLGVVPEVGTSPYLPLSEIRRRLSLKWTLVPCDHRTSGPAKYERVAENGIRIGFITPRSDCFCAGCDRIRVTSSGLLYTCLDEDSGTDLRPLLRGAMGDALLGARIDQAVMRKRREHGFLDVAASEAFRRSMNVTGG